MFPTLTFSLLSLIRQRGQYSHEYIEQAFFKKMYKSMSLLRSIL